MARKHLIVDVAFDVVDEISSKWLCLKDVSFLDSAFVSNKEGLRAEYLQVLRNTKGSFRLGCDQPTFLLLNWTWSRGVAVRSLNLTPAFLMFCQCQDEVQTHFVFSHVRDLFLKNDMSRDNIKFCKKIIERTTTNWVHFISLRVGGMCNKLKELVHCLMPVSANLINVHFMLDRDRNRKDNCSGFLDDEDVAVIARSCPRLTSFNVEQAQLLTSKAIKVLADYSHSLVSLKLRQSRLIGNSLNLLGLSQFAASLTSLELHVDYMSVVQVACLLTHLPRLRSLVLREWKSLLQSDQDHLKVAIAEYCPYCVLRPPML